MIKSQSEIIDKMYEIVGIERQEYSPQEYAKEEGTYQPGCMWPQYFFESYPVFTKAKCWDILNILVDYCGITIDMEPGPLGSGYYVITWITEEQVEAEELNEVLAAVVVRYYEELKSDLREQIKRILCGETRY